METIGALAQAWSWPVVLLVLILIFRSEIRGAFGRIRTAVLPGGTQVSFGEAEIDQRSQRERGPTRSGLTIDSRKTGSLFWLGHDLMWTADAVLRGAPSDRVLHGIDQSLHHIRQVGLANSSHERTLLKLFERTESLSDSEWNSDVRDEFATALDRLLDQVGALAEAQEPGFRPDAD